MSFLGGFGAVAYVRAGLIQDLIKAIHFRHGDRFRTPVRGSFEAEGRTVAVEGDVFLECPRIGLRRADAAARVSLSAWARLRVSSQGEEEVCLVRLRADVRAPFVIEPEEGAFPLYGVLLDLSRFTLSSASVQVPWMAPARGPYARRLALEGSLRDLIVQAIRPLARTYLRISIPVEFLDSMRYGLMQGRPAVIIPTLRPTGIGILDGSLAVGFDLFDHLGTVGSRTSGNAAVLRLPWQGWVDRCLEQRALAGVTWHGPKSPEDADLLVALDAQVLEEWGASNLHRALVSSGGLSGRTQVKPGTVLKLHRGWVDLVLNVQRSQDWPVPDIHGGITASLIPMHDHIRPLKTTIHHNVSGLVEFLGQITGEIEGTVREMVRGRMNDALRRANWILPQVRYGGELPGASGAPGKAELYVRHDFTAVDPLWLMVGVRAAVRGVDSQINFRNRLDEIHDPDVLSTPRIDGPDRSRRIRDESHRFVTVTIDPHPTLRRDPSLRLRWTIEVTNPDGTSRVLPPVEAWSDDFFRRAVRPWQVQELGRVAVRELRGRGLRLDLWAPELYVSTAISIRLDYYRPPYRSRRVVKTHRLLVKIEDRFRRDLPYVRWRRGVGYKVTAPDGTRRDAWKWRRSAVHKTSIWERCKFCDTGSNRPVVEMEYLDVLPPPARGNLRSQLCHYCFGLSTR